MLSHSSSDRIHLKERNLVGFSLIQDFVTKTQKITDPDELQQAFGEGIELLGLDKYTCMSPIDINNPPADAIWLYPFPEEWINKHGKPKQKSSKPPKFDLDTEFDIEAEFDLENVISVPLNLPGHYTCHVNMADNNLNINSVSYQNLHIMAVTYHHNIIKIRYLSNTLFQPPKLSPREKECLIWAAKGLSDHDIGALLAISSSTVTSYMKNVRHKFEVRTKIQAVAIAVFCGIIHP